MKAHGFLKFIFYFILIVILIFLYGHFFETKIIKVNEYNVESSNLTSEFHGLKIVQISDIHYGQTTDAYLLKKLVSKVNSYKPDIVVFTGNLIDKDYTLKNNNISSVLKNIDSTIGKYAIIGNEDYKVDNYISIMNKSGFKILNNSSDTIYYKGLDFMTISGLSSFKDEKNINKKTNNYKISNKSIYNILLMHEPDYIDQLNSNSYDLILAGHSLGGIVRLPVVGGFILPDGSIKYNYGHYKINESDLFVSPGIGTNKLQIRTFNMASFNVYRLIKTD